MSTQASWRRAALIGLTLALSACAVQQPPSPGPATPSAGTPESLRADWRDEIIYFAVTDRFDNGNPANDNGANRNAGDRADPTNPLAWQGGDLAGLTRKIQEGYFRKMGFTAIWISPVTLQVPAIPVGDGPNQGKTFAGYHGYWAQDFVQIDPHFGSLDDLKTFVSVAKQNGLKIIQDVVVNHAGYGSPLVAQHPEWFNTAADCQTSSNKDVDCDLAGLPDFKQSVPGARQYLNDFINYWTRETGITALRMDTMKHVEDGYWRSFFAAGGPGDPAKIWTVGEVFNGDPAALARYMDDLGAPSVFDFALHFAVKDQLSNAGGNLDAVAGVFARDTAYSDPRRLTTFVDNHDVKRFVNEVTDRGGNDAEARERLDLALSLIYASRGTPSVYYGSEIALKGGGDPYNFPVGGGNREPMRFGDLATSTLDERLGALASARQTYRALRDGAQQELWRPNGGAPILAYRRVVNDTKAGANDQPVVFVLNNGNAPVDLASLPGGGLPLLGTFGGAALTEVTGRASNLAVQDGKLVGTVPPRTLLAVTAPAGTGGTTTVNPALGDPTGVAAQPGDGAARVTWTAPTDPNAVGYRVYQRRAGGTFTQLNFVPLTRATTSFLARGLTNGAAYEFKVVSVDAQGRESNGQTATATPSGDLTARVTFTVDARTQGNGPVQLRRFDTGGELRVNFDRDPARPGFWTKTIDLPLFREVKFKFGNAGAGAKNSGYEGPNQPDRSFVVGAGANTYTGVYDFITEPVPNATITGTVVAGNTVVPGAVVSAASNPELYYGIVGADGSYFLRVPSGSQRVSASAAGLIAPAPRTVTAPAENVNFNFTRDANLKYTLDSNLADWTNPKVRVTSADPFKFGPDNNIQELLADSDDNFLYLAYRYRIDNNGMLVYLDLKPGGFKTALGLNAWSRNVVFEEANAGIDFFLARWNRGDDLQLWRSEGGSQVSQLATPNTRGPLGGDVDQVVELAIPWSVFGGKPTSERVNIYAALVGGDNYGAGDILPNLTSNPAANNDIVGCYDTCRAVFREPIVLNTN